jgi:hypothetical protein
MKYLVKYKSYGIFKWSLTNYFTIAPNKSGTLNLDYYLLGIHQDTGEKNWIKVFQILQTIKYESKIMISPVIANLSTFCRSNCNKFIANNCMILFFVNQFAIHIFSVKLTISIIFLITYMKYRKCVL